MFDLLRRKKLHEASVHTRSDNQFYKLGDIINGRWLRRLEQLLKITHSDIFKLPWLRFPIIIQVQQTNNNVRSFPLSRTLMKEPCVKITLFEPRNPGSLSPKNFFLLHQRTQISSNHINLLRIIIFRLLLFKHL
jgi:hypothetical protein